MKYAQRLSQRLSQLALVVGLSLAPTHIGLAQSSNNNTVSYSQFLNALKAGEVSSVELYQEQGLAKFRRKDQPGQSPPRGTAL